jgi:ATP-dependent DNA helicase
VRAVPLSPSTPSDSARRLTYKLCPFISVHSLRRLKTDVEKSLPPKKEYLLHAPITAKQKVLYEAVLERNIRSFLIQQKSGTGDDAAVEEAKPVIEEAELLDENGLPKRVTRGGKKKDYGIEDDDDKYFDDLEDSIGQPVDDDLDATEMGKAYKLKAASKTVNNMNLQNIVMQVSFFTHLTLALR